MTSSQTLSVTDPSWLTLGVNAQRVGHSGRCQSFRPVRGSGHDCQRFYGRGSLQVIGTLHDHTPNAFMPFLWPWKYLLCLATMGIAFPATGESILSYEYSYVTSVQLIDSIEGTLVDEAVDTIRGFVDPSHATPAVLDKTVSLGVNATATARGSVSFAQRTGGTQLNLKLTAKANAAARFVSNLDYANAFAYVDVSASMSDWVRLQGNGVIPSDDRRLTFVWDFDGIIRKQDKGSPAANPNLVAVARLNLRGDDGAGGFANVRYERNSAGWEVGPLGRFESGLGATLPLSDDYRIDFQANYQGFARSFNGMITLSTQQTAKLVAITFPDGTTPEERGFTLQFGSGLTSPNLVDHESPVVPVGLPGDFNGDGLVDAADYSVWRDSYGQIDIDLMADADGDLDVDDDDYAVWSSNYGASAAPDASAAVPEPTALVLVFGLLIARACVGLPRNP